MPDRAPDVPPLDDLPERVATLADALVTIGRLGPVLDDVVVPGPRARIYSRRGEPDADRPGPPPPCPSCAGPQQWRALTWAADDPLRGHAGPPAPVTRGGRTVAGHHGPERRRAWCPRCDDGTPALGASPSPADWAILATRVEVEQVLDDAYLRLTDALTGHRVEVLDALLQVAAAAGLPVVADLERRLVTTARAVRAALRDREPMVRISARCPWCNALSLVMWPDRGEVRQHRRPVGDGSDWIGGVVECSADSCECEDPDCRCHRRAELGPSGARPHARYLHRWDNDQWPRLSVLIGVDLLDVARRAA